MTGKPVEPLPMSCPNSLFGSVVSRRFALPTKIAGTFVFIFTLPLLPIDETRYVTVAWEMRQSGHWLLPTLNGEPYDLDEPLSVADLLVRLSIDPRRVAVEHNLVILKRPRFGETLIQEGDRVEIVNFVGGG